VLGLVSCAKICRALAQQMRMIMIFFVFNVR